MDDLLRNWGLEELIPRFVDEKITLTGLLNIEGDLLKELIPSIGDRYSFILRRNEYKKNLESEGTDQGHRNSADLHFAESLTTGCGTSTVPSVAGAASATVSTAAGSSSAASATVTTAAGPSCAASTSAADGSVASASSRLVRGTRSATSGGSTLVQRVVAQFSLSSYIASFDIESTLSRHLKADTATAFFERHGFLSNSCRTSVVDALMKAIIAEAKSKGCVDSIRNEHLSELASRICERFPGEDKFAYYIPPSKGSVSKGRLPVKLRNSRKVMKKNSVQSQSTREEDVADVDDPGVTSDNDSTVDVEGAVNFLACTRSPWPEVEEKWKWTFKLRRRLLADGETYPLTNDYFEAWPVLRHPSGCTLLESDFNSIFPGKELSIFSRWPLFEQKVLKLAETDLHDKASKHILQLLKPTSTEDSRAAIIFSILPAICTPTQRLVKPNKETWVPTIAESRRSLLLIVEAETHIRKSLQSLQDTQALLGLRMQPIIIVVGKLEKISKCYVAIDKVVWRCTCFKKAVDTCFKSIFATDTKYPSESAHIWEAIQKSIYGIHKKRQDSFRTVLDKI